MIAKIGPVAYKLQLPVSSRIHPVFHVSLLKKVVGDYHVEKELPKELESEPESGWEPVQVLATRTITKDNEAVKQLLIQWKGKDVAEATWEDEFIMRSQFPALRLEDKSDFQGGDIDRPIVSDVGLDEQRVVHEERPKV